MNKWLREIAPSIELREWFGHDPAKWNEFKKRYWKELEKKQEIISILAEEAKGKQVTFVFATRDEKHNNAVALREYIERHTKK